MLSEDIELINDVAEDLTSMNYIVLPPYKERTPGFSYDKIGFLSAYPDIYMKDIFHDEPCDRLHMIQMQRERILQSDLAVVVSRSRHMGSTLVNDGVDFAIDNGVPVLFSRKPLDVVTLSGSMKNAYAMITMQTKLTHTGHLVLVPQHLHERASEMSSGIPAPAFSPEEIEKLHEIHNTKIRISKRIVVVTTDWYFGQDTAREIRFAKQIDAYVNIYDSNTKIMENWNDFEKRAHENGYDWIELVAKGDEM